MTMLSIRMKTRMTMLSMRMKTRMTMLSSKMTGTTKTRTRTCNAIIPEPQVPAFQQKEPLHVLVLVFVVPVIFEESIVILVFILIESIVILVFILIESIVILVFILIERIVFLIVSTILGVVTPNILQEGFELVRVHQRSRSILLVFIAAIKG
jgi:hypothetical protein